MTVGFHRFVGAGLLGGCAVFALLAGACGGGGGGNDKVDISNVTVDGGKQNAGQASADKSSK